MDTPFSWNSLADTPSPGLEEMIGRARRLVSHRVGIIAEVLFQEIGPADPAVYWASSIPANVLAFAGQPALNEGSATSTDPNRAIIKAVGETIERYCSALYDESQLLRGVFQELEGAVDPSRFALFSSAQYAQAGFRFTPLDAHTPLRWVPGRSLTTGQTTLVPAALAYVPYRRDPQYEPVVSDPISTGLACAPNLVSAIYKGLLEGIERDAFMIVWQNRLSCPHIDLNSVQDPFIKRLLRSFEHLPFQCRAVLLTLDIPVPVILIVFEGVSGRAPFTVVGLGADLNPRHALMLALEEACLGLIGMSRLIRVRSYASPEPDFRDVTDLEKHGLAHALLPELRSAMDFVMSPVRTVRLADVPDVSSGSVLTNLRTVVEWLKARDLDAIAVDLTTPDVDEAGFKVVRTLVPGLQPLDNDHSHRHLGGRRLREVPLRLGLTRTPRDDQDFNPFPHPFP